MTASQFARAVQAEPKWVQNATRILGKRFRYSIPEARWLALVRLLNRHFALPLMEAGKLASEALAAPPTERAVRVGESADGSAALVIDVARFHSSFGASLSAALTLGTPRRRGPPPRARRSDRDPVDAARSYGVDIGLTRASLALSPEERLARLDSDAAFLAALRLGGRHRRAPTNRAAARRRA